MCRMHRIFFFFFLMQQPQPQKKKKSHSLETNLSEAIFRHFQYATIKIAEHKMLAMFERKGSIYSDTSVHKP